MEGGKGNTANTTSNDSLTVKKDSGAESVNVPVKSNLADEKNGAKVPAEPPKDTGADENGATGEQADTQPAESATTPAAEKPASKPQSDASGKPAATTPAVETTPTKPAASEQPAVSYRNCTAVREAGAAPLYEGDPGYSRKLDLDGDGVACE
nr:excalibur calcium-binding domain-containing protein [Paenibacillus sp. MMS18-CY102]